MRFKLINNHVCLISNGNYYIIDTGSPSSFSIGGDHTLSDNGICINLSEGHLNADGAASLLDGIAPRGLLGVNAFSKGLYIKFDEESTDEGNIFFECRGITDAVELNLANSGWPLIAKLEINGHRISSIIDTGAYIPYVTGRMIDGMTNSGTAYDFLGMANRPVEVPMYDITVCIAWNHYDIKAGYHKIPEGNLKGCGADLIFSPFTFGIRELNIDFGHKLVQFR